jgi:hypothetical protein
MCSDYGVVCGRISVNNGLGVPNARVSIFVPQLEKHLNDPVISALYPYTEIGDKNSNNYRYNLLPSRKQHGGHEPTGTFFDQEDILTREEILEVYETYYSYTVKTNSSGDFMIWGVPLGQQTIHVDVDLSDIGCFSLRPYDFMRQGDGVDKFKNKYTFKASEDLNTLPQIVSFDKTIEIFPFWGNDDFCEIGLTRTDFDLSEKGINITPTAFIIGGIYTDNGKSAVNKNCRPKKKMGRKCDLVAKSGKIEAIRFTPKKNLISGTTIMAPILEEVNLQEDISDDGGFVFPIEMNMDYVYTNEFGENEITNDPNKGVPTSACYRFRIGMNDNDLSRARVNADYLVPNIREFNSSESEIDASYYFGTQWSGYPTNAVSTNSDYGILYSEMGEYYPKDYFYRFNYNKVYTVSSFHSNYQVGGNFANINELHPAEEEDCGDKLTPPSNFGFKNYTFTLLLADFLLSLDYIIKWVVLQALNFLVKDVLGPLGELLIDYGAKSAGRGLRRSTSLLQINNTTKLSLINYPECEECSTEDLVVGGGGDTTPLVNCKVAEITLTGITNNAYDRIITLGNNIDNITGFTDNAYCVSQGATSVNDFSELTADQNLYVLEYGGGVVFLDPNIGGSYIYEESGIYKLNDRDFLFNQNIEYLVSVRKIGVFQTNPTSTTQLESGCSLYDTLYDETLATGYFVTSGNTRTYKPTFLSGYNIESTLISGNATGVAGTDPYGPPINGLAQCRDMESEVFYLHTATPSKRSEFANGVFYIVPGTQSSTRLTKILNEYYRRKRVGKMFCGGIVNYAFIDNWLSGSLYFTQFKGKRIITAINRNNQNLANYCRNIARLVVGQKRLYYRSSPTSNGTTFTPKNLNKPTTFVDLGPRDEFIKEICVDPKLDPNCSVSRSIGATSYQDLGELLGLAINYRMDTANANGNLNMFFDNYGFSNGVGISNVLDGDILQLLSINNETGIEEFDLQNPKYLGYSFNVLDPEVYPQVFKNGTSVYGPLPVTMELNDDGQRIRSCLNEEGRLTESAQKVPFYLWNKRGTGFGPYDTNKNNQSWDYTTSISIVNRNVQPLQGMTYNYNLTGDTSDQYLLLPMTYTFSGLTISGNSEISGTTVEFDVVSDVDDHTNFNSQYPGFTYLFANSETNPTSGTLYTRYGDAGTDGIVGWSKTTGWTNTTFTIKRTQDYYSGNKQILSTPFQFYFGLNAGKTGMDKFIDLFGPKGAFPSAE